MNRILQILSPFWKSLYPNEDFGLLVSFCEELIQIKENQSFRTLNYLWYKKAVVYSLYVDKFNEDFFGLIKKLDYLQNLGVNCLWLLPILESPMRDAGFDISNFRKIRKSLFGDTNCENDASVEMMFNNFVNEAHNRNINIIFDIAFNHCSDQHEWFQNAKNDVDSPYRNYFIWSDDDKKYSEARVIFKGLCDSNWTRCGNSYYFHRFFEFQPDLNYKNPNVLLEMTHNLLHWLKFNVDGFRADAIPYLWKEDGNDCENLPQTHIIIKFIRSVLEFVRPNTLLLAEACQKPSDVVKYIGNNDECNAGYHFPLMPMIFKSIAQHDKNPITNVLDENVTPRISTESQWFTFLRCHDELSLEDVYVSESDRKYLHDTYCKNPLWNFREGQGISSRLSNLMDFDIDKIKLAFSLIFTLPGTPVIYYGDEFGMANDEAYYYSEISVTGKNDTRYLVRGKIDWSWLNSQFTDNESFNKKLFNYVNSMISLRNRYDVFGQGGIEWLDLDSDSILAYYRINQFGKVLVINNLSNDLQIVDYQVNTINKRIELKRYESKWIWVE